MRALAHRSVGVQPPKLDQTRRQDSHLSGRRAGFFEGPRVWCAKARIEPGETLRGFLWSLEQLGLLEPSSSFPRGLQPQSSRGFGPPQWSLLSQDPLHPMARPRARAQASWLNPYRSLGKRWSPRGFGPSIQRALMGARSERNEEGQQIHRLLN